MTRPISSQDLWNLKRVGQPEHIPYSTSIVVAVSGFPDGEEATSQLFTVDRNGGTEALTSRLRHASSPASEPSGQRIAFLSKTGDEKAQAHIIDLGGGEASRVTDLPLGVRHVTWVPNGESLIVVAPLLRGFPDVAETEKELESRDDAPRPVVTEDRVFRHWKRWLAGDTIDHIFRVDIADGSLHHLTEGLDRLIGLGEFADSITVTPDGTTIFLTLDDDPDPWNHLRLSLYSLPVHGGEMTAVPTGAAANTVRPRVSPDGTMLVYGAQYERDYYADHVRIVAHHLATGTETILTQGWDRSAAGWEFIGSEELVFHAEDEGHIRIFTMSLEPSGPIPQTSGGSNHGARPGVDCFWHRSESMHQPPEVAFTCGGHTKIVSAFNDTLLSDLDLRQAEEIRFTGSDNKQIQAFIVEPPGFDAATTWPLLHNVHGGPHNGVMDSWSWRWNTQVMAAAGYVVASVNFHGSSSFGDDFTRCIRGAWGDKPAGDIDAATDHLLDRGYIDASRMAIAGGSYGGYLVTWITTQTDRYKTSICHAGVTDLGGQWASDHTAGREIAVGGVPWDDMDAVQRWSPMAHTHDITTPTLVIHGEADYRVVVTQGLVLYGVLKAMDVPARLVYFPDEGHWIETRRNAELWWSEFLTWLERWVEVGTTP
ncbi:MAG: prolyl oligopeptidase family serine peptidase [Proteobacteria bacterium]|nr:prolyl oligopeptidase family serine peptidase [Pseudomonadota bacterium]